MKQKVFNCFKRVASFYQTKPVIACMAIALTLNFLIELLSRHSLLKAIVHLCTNPLIFIYNTAIIFMTLSLSFLFKRRNFIVTFLSVLWFSLGLLNCILLFFRTTPLSLIDFMIVKTAISMLPVYLSVFEIILIILWIVAIIVSGIIAWIKMPRHSVKFKKAVALVLSTASVVVVTSIVSTSAAAKNGSFAILTKAYENLGFVYCFSRGLIDSGIDKPSSYSEVMVDAALDKINAAHKEEDVFPNIVIVQLESFFDPIYLKNFTVSENPIPTFTYLKEACPSGLLTMPSLGGGTANSEFEVLTGMNLDHFGVGEYPYQTVLKDTPFESMAYTLKDKGYKSTALHNHTATFYNRHIVYSNLGFDRFIPVEYMDIPERNELGWAKDNILIGQIMEALNSTFERDFVFTVTMQGHGKYPTEEIDYEKIISVTGNTPEVQEQTEFLTGLEYYLNQLRETDMFVTDLVRTLEEYPEPVALVLYGDHLPAFEITDADLNGISMYQTEYCIWTNYMPLENTKEDLYAYQLNALLFDKLNLNSGLFPRITQTLKDNEHYEDVLSLIAYDILYGENYSADKELKPSELMLGMYPITVNEAKINKKYTKIYGEGFTTYSHVLIDGKKVETQFIDSNTLRIKTQELDRGECIISVAQINKEFITLSESNSIPVNFN